MIEDRFYELLNIAIENKATDVHFDISNNKIKITLRNLFGLTEIKSTDIDLKLFNYIKYRAQLDISCLTKPQSGTFDVVLNNYLWLFRFSVIESFNHKNGVLRILNMSKISSPYELSQNQEDIREIINIFSQDYGLVLVAGSTGSGKSTTIYSILSVLENKCIYSIEDPIEIYQSYMSQIQINKSIGLDFKQAFKQLLRHDPDVVLIGEVRSDYEIKEAYLGSLTGHLVVSSIHASDVYSVINRLIESGINYHDLIHSNLNIIVQQLERINNRQFAKYQIYNQSKIKNILEQDFSKKK